MTPQHIASAFRIDTATHERPCAMAARTGCKARVHHPGVCDACGASLARQARLDALRDARESVPERFRWAKPDSPDLAARVKSREPMTLAKVQAYAAGLASGEIQSLTLRGQSRDGKTSLAAAVFYAVLRRGFDGDDKAFNFARGARFIPAIDLDEGTVDTAVDATLLVLDDLGQELGGAQEGSGMLSQRVPHAKAVIQKRHNAMRPTIVTTYMSTDELARFYGDGDRKRLEESGQTKVVRLGVTK